MRSLGFAKREGMMTPARAGMNHIKDGVQHLVIDKVR